MALLSLEVSWTDRTGHAFACLMLSSMSLCLIAGLVWSILTHGTVPTLSRAPDVPLCPDAGLRHQVDIAITGVCESSAAANAGVGLLFSVNSTVTFEILGPHKPLATNVTHIWSFTCMDIADMYIILVAG